MQVPSERPTSQALRQFRNAINERVKRLLHRYSALLYALPGTEEMSLPDLQPTPRPGETDSAYRRRVASSFLRRAATVKRDISAYFFYQQVIDERAIFEFAVVAPLRLALHEQWVFEQLMHWWDDENRLSINKLFGFYRGQRPRERQDERQVLYHAVRAKIEQLCSETGCSIQAALQELEGQRFCITLDQDPEWMSLSKSALEDIYYARGSYQRYRNQNWQIFYQVYEIAEAIMESGHSLNPLSKSFSRYHRKYNLPSM